MKNSWSSYHYQLQVLFPHHSHTSSRNTQSTSQSPFTIHKQHSQKETTPIHSTNQTSFPFPTHERIAFFLLRSHPPPSLYVLHGMEHGSEGAGRMRSAFHPERVLHPVQLRPDEYDGLYRVWTEQVHHESCGEGKPVSDVHSSLRHGRNPLLAGRTGIFLYNGKLLCFFALWVVGYACMGTLWPILCIVFKQWLPDNCTPSSPY